MSLTGVCLFFHLSANPPCLSETSIVATLQGAIKLRLGVYHDDLTAFSHSTEEKYYTTTLKICLLLPEQDCFYNSNVSSKHGVYF